MMTDLRVQKAGRKTWRKRKPEHADLHRLRNREPEHADHRSLQNIKPECADHPGLQDKKTEHAGLRRIPELNEGSG